MTDPTLFQAATAVGLVLAGILATALLHSSVLLGGAWLVVRRWKPKPRVEELIWRGALMGAVLSTAIASSTLLPDPLTGRRLVYGVSLARATAEPDEGSRATDTPDRPGVEASVPAEGAASPAPWDERRGSAGLASPPTGGVPSVPVRAAGERPSPPESTESAPGPGADAVAISAAAAGYLWAGGVLFLLVRLAATRMLLGWRFRRREAVDGSPLRRLRRLGRTVGLRTPVTLTVSSEVRSPIALPGAEVCVPPRFFRDLEPEEQDAALAHELAHVARRDPLWGPWIRVARSFLFFHPLAAPAERRLGELAEIDCDRRAADCCGPGSLASSLAAIAAWCVSDRREARAGVTALAPEAGELAQRVRRLLDHGPSSGPRIGGRAVATSVSAAVVVGLIVPSVGLSVPGVEPGSGASGRADEPEHATIRRIPISSPSLGDRWRRAVAVAARDGDRALVVEYGLLEPESAPDDARHPHATRILAVRSPGEAADAPGLKNVSLRGSGPEGVEASAGPVFDLGRVHPDSSARWLRDRAAELARADADPELQHHLLEVLAAHPGGVSEAYLIRLAWIHPLDAVRRRAVELLAKRPSKRAFRELTLMIRRHPEPAVVRRALAAVADYPEERALPVLERAAAGRPEAGLREIALRLARPMTDEPTGTGPPSTAAEHARMP